MYEILTAAFIIYFVVIDPVGNAPIFLAVTETQDWTRRLRTALEGFAIATAFMLFFALCRSYILSYLKITKAAFKITSGIILFVVALDMLAAKLQQHKCAQSTGGGYTSDNSPYDSDSKNSPYIRQPSHFSPDRRSSCW